MRLFGLGLLVANLFSLALTLPGCKGGGVAPTDASGDVEGDAPSTAGPGTGGKNGGGSDGSGGGASGTGGQVHDCFPSCVVNLRRACEKPPVDAGSCTSGVGLKCYSNGVHELISFSDAGQLTVYTLPDGKTVCYQVLVDLAGSVLHFQTPAGQEIAAATGVGNGIYSVTCDGMTHTVDTNDPNCSTLNLSNCVSGTCP